MRILLVEDEEQMAAALAAVLAKQGIVIDHTKFLEDAFELTCQHVYDAILLDRHLPDGEGLTIIPRLRARGSDTPVIVLSAKNNPQERIDGLNAGADDYLGKPFLVDELMARLRAVIRRPPHIAAPQITVGDLTIDALHFSATVAGVALELPRRELLVLLTLAKRQGKTTTRTVLESAVYNYEEEIQSNTLDAHVSRLRKRLLDAGSAVTIRNIRGVGFLMREN
ncbi:MULTISPECIES: response regulator transcription factor [Rhizobium]|uniref:DNA-binding response regulator, OmpR family, contains REC and winged-helix (WHTH) domain n=1 Tax=Rhizobium miluonense TaxID=411945 RepID=A0A1C3WI34_9HYPH|nr:response regulator transcription factor [Rhizobium miluonense]SCB39575.1 DNA-binding response regulator, OmpR family, contains REC and winged-helix (wHTH) domain [Rhizobium miluonense]